MSKTMPPNITLECYVPRLKYRGYVVIGMRTGPAGANGEPVWMEIRTAEGWSRPAVDDVDLVEEPAA